MYSENSVSEYFSFWRKHIWAHFHQTIFKNILYLFLTDLQHNFWFAEPYGLASKKLCFIQMLLNVEKNLENKTKNGW